MILNRLYELAVRKGLLADPAFENLAVPFVIQVGEGGKFLGIDGEKPRQPKKGEAKVERKQLIPRPHSSTASPGTARYLADTLPRVLPIVFEEAEREKEILRRKTFWQQIDTIADATNDPALRAMQQFGRKLTEQPFQDVVRKAFEAKQAAKDDRVTFSYFVDGTLTVVERPSVSQWYRTFFRASVEAKKQGKSSKSKSTSGSRGFCTITGSSGPLPQVHPIPLKGVPERKNGKLSYQSTGVKIVSFDKPAFWHYGMVKATAAGIGYEAADGYSLGFQWLRERPTHNFIAGGTLFLFWTRVEVDLGDINQLYQPVADQVNNSFVGLKIGKESSAVEDANDFYLLAVSGNSARVIVRDYLERPLREVLANVHQWFVDLLVADTSRDYRGRENAAFSMKILAAATVRWRHKGERSEADWDAITDETCVALMRSALYGEPPPDSLLGACLLRLEAEGWRGFRPSRMALMKLILIRREVAMSKVLDEDDERPPYLFGRLLALFERIQYRALGEVNSNVVDKHYATFSSNPMSILGGLQQLARAHLKKMRTDATKRGAGVNLQRDLTRMCERIASGLDLGQPPKPFSRYERAVFSFGYYHQKAIYLFPPDKPDADGNAPTDFDTPDQTQE